MELILFTEILQITIFQQEIMTMRTLNKVEIKKNKVSSKQISSIQKTLFLVIITNLIQVVMNLK